MIKKLPIDTISGFLGSGKTTLLNTLLKTRYKDIRVAVIENEFGQVDIDSALLPKDIEITKITGGCVCCTLKLGFIDAIKQLAESFELDRIVIETTGVAKLSDVISAIQNDALHSIAYSANNITVINPKFHKNFSGMLGNFYKNQIEYADTVYISRKDITDARVVEEVRKSIIEINDNCAIAMDIQEIILKSKSNYFSDEHTHIHEHHSHHEGAYEVFESTYIDVFALASISELNSLIDRIVNEAKPRIVYRIKGSALIDQKPTLVQWTRGELNIDNASSLDNKLVIISSR